MSYRGMLSNLIGSHGGDHMYNTWRDRRNEMFMQPMGEPANMQSISTQIGSATDDFVHGTVKEDPQVRLRPQLGIPNGGQSLQGHGLSLSLITQFLFAVLVPSFQFPHPNAGLSSFLGSQN